MEATRGVHDSALSSLVPLALQGGRAISKSKNRQPGKGSGKGILELSGNGLSSKSGNGRALGMGGNGCTDGYITNLYLMPISYIPKNGQHRSGGKEL